MVIKYKAKYIRDGVVVIDDTSLIELGSGDSQESGATGVLPKGRDALEQLITESEEPSENVDSGDNITSDDSASDASTSVEK